MELQGPREKQESVEEMFRKKASSVVDEVRSTLSLLVDSSHLLLVGYCSSVGFLCLSIGVCRIEKRNR